MWRFDYSLMRECGCGDACLRHQPWIQRIGKICSKFGRKYGWKLILHDSPAEACNVSCHSHSALQLLHVLKYHCWNAGRSILPKTSCLVLGCFGYWKLICTHGWWRVLHSWWRVGIPFSVTLLICTHHDHHPELTSNHHQPYGFTPMN